MKKFILLILILLISVPGFAQYGQVGGITGLTVLSNNLVFGAPIDSVIFEIPVSVESSISITTLIGTSFKIFNTAGDSMIFNPNGFSSSNSAAAGTSVFNYKSRGGHSVNIDSLSKYISVMDSPTSNAVLMQLGTSADANRFKVDEDGDVTNDGSITAGGAISGTAITGSAEANFTNNAAAVTFGAVATDADVVLAFDAVTAQGSITYMEDEDRFDFDNDLDVIVDLTAGTITSDAGIVGTSVNPAVTNVGTLGNATTIWNTGTSGTWTLGDDSDNVNGTLNFIASDGDAGNIAINTSDRLVITGSAIVASLGFVVADGLPFKLYTDQAAGNVFSFETTSAAIEITDNNDRQAWMLVAPRVLQSGTAAFDGIYVNILEGAYGDGSTGDGNNLLNLSVLSSPLFRVTTAGDVTIGVAGSSEATPTFSIIHDADSDAADTDETLAFSLTQNADPTLSLHTVTNTQNAGIDFDMPLIASTVTSDAGITGTTGTFTGNVATSAYNRYATIYFIDCFDHAEAVQYAENWDITALNTAGTGTNVITTTASHITLSTDGVGFPEDEGTRSNFAFVKRAEKNRSEWEVDLGQTANTNFYCGWNTQATNTTAADDKFVLVVYEVGQANWQLWIDDGAGADIDKYVSDVVVATGDITFELESATDGTIRFWINGTEKTHGLTEVMQADDHYLIVGQLEKTAAAVITAEIDYIENEKFK